MGTTAYWPQESKTNQLTPGLPSSWVCRGRKKAGPMGANSLSGQTRKATWPTSPKQTTHSWGC
eukprot:8313779-Lingulodinium_polyedra.AAC.1